MDVLSAVLAVVALVLAVGGALKLVDPQPTRDLLAGIGLPAPRWGPTALGVLELGVAVAVLADAGPWADAALAALYLGFTALVALALRTGPEGLSCGCFGRYSAPPSAIHLVANLVSAGVGLAAAVTAPPALLDVLADQPLAGVPLLALVGVATGLVIAITTVLPDALDAARGGGTAAGVRRFTVDPPTPEATR